MPDKRSVLLAGATGLVGSHCLKALLDLNIHDRIIVLSRRELNLPLSKEQENRLEIVIVDFDHLDKHARVFDVDEVICCLGTTIKQAGSIEAFKKVDYHYCLELARIAKAKQVPHFLIVTAVNASSRSPAYYSKIKGQLQKALVDLNFDRLSIFQPSLLLGEREQFRFGEELGAKASGLMNRILPKSMNKYKAIDAAVVGRAMAKTAADYQQSENKPGVHYLHYDEMQTLANK